MPKPLKTHQYLPDTLPGGHKDDHAPCVCGLPKRNRAHQLPDVPADVTDAEARALGEKMDDDEGC